MIRVIALTQFVFITLGTVAAIILVRSETVANSEISPLRMFLATHGLWLVLVPILWVILAEAGTRISPRPAVTNAVRASGVLLAAALLAAYGWVILAS